MRKASVGLDLGQGLGGSLNTHIPHPTGLNTSLPSTTKGRVFSVRRAHIGLFIFFLHKEYAQEQVIYCPKKSSNLPTPELSHCGYVQNTIFTEVYIKQKLCF